MKQTIMLFLFFFILSCQKESAYSLVSDIDKNNISIKVLGQNISNQEALKKIKNRSKIVLSVFDNTNDPYYGKREIPSKCKKENVPSATATENSLVISKRFSLYSSKNKSFGNCLEPKTVQKTLYELVYCKKNKTLYGITYFYSDELEWRKNSILICQ